MVKEIELSEWYNGNGKIRLSRGIDDYKELVITGRCEYMRNKRQKLIKSCDLRKTVAPNKERNGYSVDLSEWDSSDICFYTNLVWGHIIITEKAKNILKEREMESVCFQKIGDYVQVGYEAS